jgi:hypothetical protein
MTRLARDAPRCAVLVACLAGGAAGCASPPSPAAEGPATPAGDLHGYVAARYRGRATDDDQDHELRTVLALDYVPAAGRGLEAHLLARADADLDGHDDGIFSGLDDTYDGSVVTKLYTAFLDVPLGDPARPLGTLRLGRQTDVELPEVVRLDGLSFRSRPQGERALAFGLYGGIPVHLYESSSSGDLGYGSYVEGLPWAGGRARLDWLHLEDEQRFGTQRDDLLGLTLWQRLARAGWMEGRFTVLEGEERDLDLRAQLQEPRSGTLAGLRYHELLETQLVNALELDPFSEQLLEYHPYRELGADVSRPFGRHLDLELGLGLRRVSDDDDVGDFNRDWQRLYATGTLSDWLAEGLALGLTAERWDDEAENDTSAFGADLTLDRGRGWRASLGSYYALYKYRLLELEEKEDVQTYYLRTARDVGTRLTLELLYEFEDDDLETYHLLTFGGTWRF